MSNKQNLKDMTDKLIEEEINYLKLLWKLKIEYALLENEEELMLKLETI